LNLLASGREVEVVRSLDLRLLVTPQVAVEALFLWTPPDADGRREKVPASTDTLRAEGLMETRALDSVALLDAFVRAAERIADGDASCIAVAGVLGLPLVTDDRKERRLAADFYPTVEFISTLDLVKDASRALGWSDDELAAVAAALRWRGNFGPPRRDPRSEWSISLLKRAGVEPP
jgi:hypothetical protein